MLKAIGSLFERLSPSHEDHGAQSRERQIQLATALLLIEIARADYKVDLAEDLAVHALLKDFFDLDDEHVQALIDRANEEADHAASLQKFTRQLHEELSVEEKCRVVEMLWQVALADDHLDKHEDHLVRKVAGLLYVSHADLIRIRNQVRRDH